VKFNIPRNCKTFCTKTNFFVELGFKCHEKIAVPIKQNRNYRRFALNMAQGWACKTFGVAGSLMLVAYLQKEKEVPRRSSILGVDVNVRCFAVTVLAPKGKVLYQMYLGKNIYAKRRSFMLRRAKLHLVSARKELRQLRHMEHGYVKNALGEVTAQIARLAGRFGAEVAIEDLQRFPARGKRFNRKVMRMPFYRFKMDLKQRCLATICPCG
jgi:hypothetical protein